MGLLRTHQTAGHPGEGELIIMDSNEKVTPWSEAQVKVIAMYQEKLGMSRSNAIRKMRGQEIRGVTPEQQLANGLAEKPAPVEKVREKHDVGSNPVKVVEKKERKAGVAYADRHKAGLCVKCGELKTSESAQPLPLSRQACELLREWKNEQG
jgi:hypothetical protein